MDITTVFGTVIVGSNPAGDTNEQSEFGVPAGFEQNFFAVKIKKKSVVLEEFCEYIVNTWNDTNKTGEKESCREHRKYLKT